MVDQLPLDAGQQLVLCLPLCGTSRRTGMCNAAAVAPLGGAALHTQGCRLSRTQSIGVFPPASVWAEHSVTIWQLPASWRARQFAANKAHLESPNGIFDPDPPVSKQGNEGTFRFEHAADTGGSAG